MVSVKVFEKLLAKEEPVQVIADFANEQRKEVLMGVFALVSLFKPKTEILVHGEQTTPEEVTEAARQMGFDELVDLFMGLAQGFSILEKDYTGHYKKAIEFLERVKEEGVVLEDEC